VRGGGFPQASGATGLDGGAAVSLRLGLRRAWSPFLELGGTVWPVARAALERVDGNRRRLPRLEAGVALGILFAAAGDGVRSTPPGTQRE
jgi:hypothetical protein